MLATKQLLFGMRRQAAARTLASKSTLDITHL